MRVVMEKILGLHHGRIYRFAITDLYFLLQFLFCNSDCVLYQTDYEVEQCLRTVAFCSLKSFLPRDAMLARYVLVGWLRGPAVEHRSLAGVLSLSWVVYVGGTLAHIPPSFFANYVISVIDILCHFLSEIDQ